LHEQRRAVGCGSLRQVAVEHLDGERAEGHLPALAALALDDPHAGEVAYEVGEVDAEESVVPGAGHHQRDEKRVLQHVPHLETHLPEVLGRDHRPLVVFPGRSLHAVHGVAVREAILDPVAVEAGEGIQPPPLRGTGSVLRA